MPEPIRIPSPLPPPSNLHLEHLSNWTSYMSKSNSKIVMRISKLPICVLLATLPYALIDDGRFCNIISHSRNQRERTS
ncbi:14215_t:CDS:2 [Funneliformis caledonium]|uniref:14215_t:CDS:1 n=1 Tax=Funneliformis caledonium TaxID=1117310 RepID=A0A9N9B565_9GLOM|nr:14215_t:CDS:2 [Funneliformis caledonium]